MEEEEGRREDGRDQGVHKDASFVDNIEVSLGSALEPTPGTAIEEQTRTREQPAEEFSCKKVEQVGKEI